MINNTHFKKENNLLQLLALAVMISFFASKKEKTNERQYIEN